MIKIKIRGKLIALDELRKEQENENSYFIEFMECLYSHIEMQQKEIERIERVKDICERDNKRLIDYAKDLEDQLNKR